MEGVQAAWCIYRTARAACTKIRVCGSRCPVYALGAPAAIAGTNPDHPDWDYAPDGEVPSGAGADTYMDPAH